MDVLSLLLWSPNSKESFCILKTQISASYGFQRVLTAREIRGLFCAVSAIDLSGESFSNAVRREFDCEDMSAYSGVSFDDEIGVERFNSESKTRSSFLRRLADWSASEPMFL
ncbi:MAG: hypothetical protein ACLUKN_13355 [Bacilli bacterium]